MRKIQFNEETVNKIRDFIESGHTLKETCNRFTLKADTLYRVMRENNIEPFYKHKRNKLAHPTISKEVINLVCNLFEYTETPLLDIRIQAKLEHYQLMDILREHFTQEQFDRRKSKMYAKSKIGSNNPMFEKTFNKHHNFIGDVEDGKGYLMCVKPDWYTGRKNSNHIYVHHYVMCVALGLTEIPPGFSVHHIDGNKKNNSISNLALVEMGAHTKWHALLNRMCKAQRLSENGVGCNSETPNND